MITITTVITILIVILVKVTICCSWICKQNYIVLCVKMRPQSIPSESCHESQWERLTNYIAIPQTSQVTISGTSRCNMESAVLPPVHDMKTKSLARQIWSDMDVSKNSEIIHFNRVFHYKPSILGYHYFWKQPYDRVYWGGTDFRNGPN